MEHAHDAAGGFLVPLQVFGIDKALGQPHTVNPRTITVDKNAAYPKAVGEMKRDAELWRRSKPRQVKYSRLLPRARAWNSDFIRRVFHPWC